jgi:energy-coupling factor transporter ATP-binding protein EcfA2
VEIKEEEKLIEVKSLGFTYQGNEEPALREINLTVRKGEFIGITGATGTGKTTLSFCMNGVIPYFNEGIYTGEVLIKGRSIFDLTSQEISRWVGSVFQDPEAQLVSANVQEELAFGPENLCIPPNEIEKRISFALKAVGIENLRNATIELLSGGQKQRVAIAAVLSMLPEIIILDEPTAELDPIGTDDVFSVLRRLNQEYGITIIIIEHKVEHLAAFCNRLLIMDQGRIVFDDSPEQVFKCWREVNRLGIRLPQVTEFFGKLFGNQSITRKLPVTLEQAKVLADDYLREEESVR